MKKVFLASVSAVTLVTVCPALAAPPAPQHSWTGCYAGAHVGGGWGSKGFSDVPGLSSFGLIDATGANTASDDISGILGGGQIGCNYEFANKWVFGLEGDLSAANLNGDVTIQVPSYSPYPSTFSAKTDWIGSVTARAGYGWDRWLVFVKGGPAWAHDKYHATNAYVGAYDASETRSGWTIGGGLEWAFADNWSANLEYDFYGFGTRALQFTQIPNSGGYYQGSLFQNVKQQIQLIKVGVNRHF